MGLLVQPVKEVWQELCKEINADYINGSVFKAPRVEYNYKNWTIFLDNYTISTCKTSITYTRIRAPFINNKNFKFKIYNKNIFSSIGKALGMQDIEIGYDDFDDEFIIKSNNEVLLKKLLNNNQITNLIQKQCHINLEAKDAIGKLGSIHNNNVSELSFIYGRVIKDKVILKELIELFTKLLDQLQVNEITINKRPEIKLYK